MAAAEACEGTLKAEWMYITRFRACAEARLKITT